MKNLIVIATCFIIGLVVISCNKSNVGKQANDNVIFAKTTGYCPIHIAFRSHPWPGGSCGGSFDKCPGCTCPIFICICTTFATPDPLSDIEKNDLIGEAEIKLISNDTKLKMIFHQQADSSGYIHLYEDAYFPQQVADSLYRNSILVKAGLYTVDFNSFTYGEATFDCEVD